MLRHGRAIVASIIVLAAALSIWTVGLRIRALRLDVLDGVRIFVTIFLLVHVWRGKVWAARITAALFFAAGFLGPASSSHPLLWGVGAACLVAGYFLAWSGTVDSFLQHQRAQR